jgi:hypothetical protein
MNDSKRDEITTRETARYHVLNGTRKGAHGQRARQRVTMCDGRVTTHTNNTRQHANQTCGANARTNDDDVQAAREGHMKQHATACGTTHATGGEELIRCRV